MSKELVVIVEGTTANGKPVAVNQEMSARELLSHLKQMVKSVAQSGIVHQIEDRKNPFTGIAVDHFEVFRAEDAEENDDDDPDNELDVFDDDEDQ